MSNHAAVAALELAASVRESAKPMTVQVARELGFSHLCQHFGRLYPRCEDLCPFVDLIPTDCSRNCETCRLSACPCQRRENGLSLYELWVQKYANGGSKYAYLKPTR